MDFGGEAAEMAIINLVVSDGDPSRGQRESLLSNEIKKVCVANEEKRMNYIDIAQRLLPLLNLIILSIKIIMDY